ncbi:MAG: hypothetical protein FD174_3658 [Geobacteraceae bacterium]|nr:MAG: hypothetical protein FD174_3658 [Geobacteraceae bacterium]
MQDVVYGIITHPTFFIPAGLFGYLLGNWFTIGRDRRKEFNEAAEALFRELTNESINPDFNTFRRRLSWYEKKRLNKCVTEYKEARSDKNKTNRDFFGKQTYRDLSLLTTTRDDLIKLTKRK